MLFIYRLLLFMALPWVIFRLIARGRANPIYFDNWRQRFGYAKKPRRTGGIWIHAVSLGETVAASAFVKHLLCEYPALPLYLTSNTLTGSQKVQALYGDKVERSFLPYDYPWMVKRFLSIVQPKVLILVESELWPNLIHACKKRNIPVVLINARLSPQSFARHQRWPSISKPMLEAVSFIAAQSQLDVERFLNLGVPNNKISYTGNLKFLINLPDNFREKAKQWRTRFAPKQPLWIAASTHPGEEEIVLAAQRKLQATIPDARVLIVPRHPERFDKVAETILQNGFTLARRTDAIPPTDNCRVILGDSMGELLEFYACSDVALVCGSLIPIGGHSLLEPAAVGVPTLTGPQYFNTTEIAEALQARNALIIVHDADELCRALLSLLQTKEKGQQMVDAGLQFVHENQDALSNTMAIVKQYIL